MLDFANKLLEATEKSIAVSKALDSYLRADSGLIERKIQNMTSGQIRYLVKRPITQRREKINERQHEIF